jgi:hypothetical protein
LDFLPSLTINCIKQEKASPEIKTGVSRTNPLNSLATPQSPNNFPKLISFLVTYYEECDNQVKISLLWNIPHQHMGGKTSYAAWRDSMFQEELL